MEKRIVLLIKLLIYGSFLLPLIVVGGFTFPFVLPKAIFFRIIVELMLGLYLWLCWINKDYRPKKSPLLIALAFFFLILLLSSIFGMDFSRSFWGNNERMTGWFTLIHFGVYFIILSQVLRSWLDWKSIFRWILLISLIAGFSSLNIFSVGDSLLKDGGGLLGNRLYLGNFLLLAILISWLLFKKEEEYKWKIYALAVAAIDFIFLFQANERGPFIGLLVGAIMGIVIYIFKVKSFKLKVYYLAPLLLLAALGSLAYINRGADFVKNIPVIGRLVSIEESSTVTTRLIAWDIAVKSWAEKPVLGWGPENFYYAFNKYYNPRSLRFGDYETWFDRSHNIFLDYLSTSGILGLLSYLAIFYVVFLTVRKRHGNNKEEIIFLAIFFLAYLSQNFFIFDNLSSYLIFFAVLAFTDYLWIVGRLPRSELVWGRSLVVGQSTAVIGYKSLKVGQILMIWPGVLILIYFTNIIPVLADSRAFQAQDVMSHDFSGGLEAYEGVFKIVTPYLADLRNDFANVVLSYSQNEQILASDAYKQAVDLVIAELNKTIIKHPLEIKTYMILGQYYSLLGDYDGADKILEKAVQLSLKRQQVAYIRAQARNASGDFAGAISLLNQVVKDDPEIPASYWYLAVIYGNLNDVDNALKNVKLAVEKNKIFTQIAEIKYAANVVEIGGDLELAEKIYEIGIDRFPEDISIIQNLSRICVLLSK